MTGSIPPPASAYASGTPRRPRPPLDRTTKVGAAIAGAVSFTMLTIGFVLFWIPILLGFIALIFTTIVRFVGRFDRDPDAGLRRFVEVVDSLNLEAWALPLVLVSVLGLAVMLLAVFTSKWILASRRIARPWAITWSGLGVAVVASTVVGGLLSSGANLVTPFLTGDDDGSRGAIVPILAVTGVISGIVSIAVNAAVGWLAMWWMAHVFRPADAVGSAASSAGAPGHADAVDAPVDRDAAGESALLHPTSDPGSPADPPARAGI